jgi:hypothetical protein
MRPSVVNVKHTAIQKPRAIVINGCSTCWFVKTLDNAFFFQQCFIREDTHANIASETNADWLQSDGSAFPGIFKRHHEAVHCLLQSEVIRLCVGFQFLSPV